MLKNMFKNCGLAVDRVLVNCASFNGLFTYGSSKIQAMFISRGVYAPTYRPTSNSLYPGQIRIFNPLISDLPAVSTPPITTTTIYLS
jgi:hypothetical protein